MTGWIGVDLDGTLAEYNSGDFKLDHLGKPIPKMVERVKEWIEKGFTVKIFTARASRLGLPDDVRSEVIKMIEDWSEAHIGMRLEVTCEKDFGMIELWDDRAVQVKMNTGEPVGFSTRGLK